jgi:hypothetical protein
LPFNKLTGSTGEYYVAGEKIFDTAEKAMVYDANKAM